MIEVIQAGESLRNVSVIALGNGLVKEPDRGMMLRAWRRAAAMGEKRRKTTLDSLVGHGIGLVFVKKGEKVARETRLRST